MRPKKRLGYVNYNVNYYMLKLGILDWKAKGSPVKCQRIEVKIGRIFVGKFIFYPKVLPSPLVLSTKWDHS